MSYFLAGVAVLVGIWLAWRLFGPDREPKYQGPQARPVKVPGRTVFVDEREFFVREVGPKDAPRSSRLSPTMERATSQSGASTARLRTSTCW